MIGDYISPLPNERVMITLSYQEIESAKLANKIAEAAKSINKQLSEQPNCKLLSLNLEEDNEISLAQGSLFTRMFIRCPENESPKKYRLWINYSSRNQEVIKLFKACHCPELHLHEISRGREGGAFARGDYHTKNPAGVRAMINMAFSEEMISMDQAVQLIKTFQL